MNQNLEAIEAAEPLAMNGKIRAFILVALLVALGALVKKWGDGRW